MSYIITDAGRDWIADSAYPGTNESIQSVVVGTGTSAPESDDTELESEIYRGDQSYDIVSITRSDNTGQIDVAITLSGGTEVTASQAITEIGVLTDAETLVYREVREPITIDNGERVTIEFSFVVGS